MQNSFISKRRILSSSKLYKLICKTVDVLLEYSTNYYELCRNNPGYNPTEWIILYYDMVSFKNELPGEKALIPLKSVIYFNNSIFYIFSKTKNSKINSDEKLLEQLGILHQKWQEFVTAELAKIPKHLTQ